MYRARDTKLDRDVALKVLPEAFTQDPETPQQSDSEAIGTSVLPKGRKDQ